MRVSSNATIPVSGRNGARCSSAHGAMGRRINHSLGGPIELFLVPASAPRLVYSLIRGMVNIKYPLLLIGDRSEM